MKVTNLFQVLVVLLVSINISFAQNFNENSYYRFTTQWQGEGKSLDVINAGEKNQLQLAKTGNYSGQAWKITPIGKGYYRLTTQWQGEGKSLDVVNDGKNNKLQLAKTGSYSGQAWKITPVGKGYYRLTTQWQGDGKSLDVINDGKNNKLQLAKTGNYTGQYWKITELSNNSANNSPQVKVNAHLKCQVVMIDANELNSPGGWWSKWHELKQAKAYKETPCSFSGLKPSTYILVAYNPASVNYDPNNGNPAEAADGVVLEQVVIKGNSKLNYNFKANDFKIWNCLSCPWLYAYNGNEYVRLTEVIQDVVGEENCQTTSHQISPEYIVDNKIKFRIQEEKDETSYLDRISLTVDGEKITPVKKELTQKDKDYLILEKGESIDLEFDLTGYNAKDHNIRLEVNGFYIPKMEFLDAVFDHYLYTK